MPCPPVPPSTMIAPWPETFRCPPIDINRAWVDAFANEVTLARKILGPHLVVKTSGLMKYHGAVYSLKTHGKLGYCMAVVKDDDPHITWDAEGMARAAR